MAVSTMTGIGYHSSSLSLGTQMAQIPPALIGTTGPILDAHYTHAELNSLFMQAGFPGDPPEGNKTQKCLSWLRRANAECAEPLSLFGTLIAEMMDVEPTPW